MGQQEYVSPSVELEPEEEKSAFDRFASVFTSPTEAFDRLKQARKGPIILWGLIITPVVIACVVLMSALDTGLYEKEMENRREKIEEARDKGMDREFYKAAIDQLDKTTKTGNAISGSVSSLLFMPIVMLLLGVLGLIIMKILARGGTEGVGYSTALSVVLITSMISLLSFAVTSIVKILTDDPGFDVSPNAFLDIDNFVTSFLIGLANPFTIWWLVVAGTGSAMVSGASRGKAIAFWAAAYVILGVLFSSVGQALRSVFGF